MLKEERQDHIMQKLIEENKVSSTELSSALAVSEDTIRRDLNELAERGLLKKVYGGAVSKSIPLLNFTERSGKDHEARRRPVRQRTGFDEKADPQAQHPAARQYQCL